MRIECYKAVLSPRSCRALQVAGVDKLQRSTVILADGHQAPDPYRTSDGAFFAYSEVPEVLEAEMGICFRAGTEIEYLEGMQILRYEVGQEFKPHQDTFEWWDPGRKSYLTQGQRLATGIYCLAPAGKGGELHFPQVGVTVRQSVGDLCLFWGTQGDHAGTPDPLALHAGLPVIEGVKWGLVGWTRQRVFRT